MPENIYIALGSNIGDAGRHFDLAASALIAKGVKIIAKSALHRTLPVGCRPGAPDFTNAVWRCEFSGSPIELLQICQEVEAAAGRPRDHGLNQDRTLDLDIIDFNGVVMNTPELTLPHPRAAERAFVQEPLAEVKPATTIR